MCCLLGLSVTVWDDKEEIALEFTRITTETPSSFWASCTARIFRCYTLEVGYHALSLMELSSS
jgi:hypothetical protein